MAGGNWTTQNKIRPGVYINVVGEKKAVNSIAERGIVSVPLILNWGQPQQMMEINAESNIFSLLGYGLDAPELQGLASALNRAKTVLVYRLNEGAKANASIGDLTATAKFGGVRGNDVKVAVQENVDNGQLFDVITYVSSVQVDVQTVDGIAALEPNAFVEFSGTGALGAAAGTRLAGGTNGSITNQQHIDFLSKIELQDFNTIALVSSDESLKAAYAAFARRLREVEGRKIQVVLAKYPAADHEGVISVKNGVKLADGTIVDAEQATVWVAAATAGAAMNKSLTYEAYEDAVDADVRYTNTQIEAALQAGEFVFTASNGRAIVEQDINTLTTLADGKSQVFAKNRVIRVLDGIANDLKHIFEASYIGKIDNSQDGRSLFRSECVKYLDSLQRRGAIQQFDSQTDLTVSSGESADSIFIDAYIKPVDSVEKVYMKVTVK
ncbi:phage tail sheath family protein [Paenibacillus harenae]|uniref:phage tail sheath family protein n=1 Tax=Paenibacillus harenae TaxID=306543 RepID=UPI002790E21A|nr:phage tail sheath family protein [Paenibacillus harenae]MDQ0063554.1 hypothetical protein [Paenibacillus harenae]